MKNKRIWILLILLIFVFAKFLGNANLSFVKEISIFDGIMRCPCECPCESEQTNKEDHAFMERSFVVPGSLSNANQQLPHLSEISDGIIPLVFGENKLLAGDISSYLKPVGIEPLPGLGSLIYDETGITMSIGEGIDLLGSETPPAAEVPAIGYVGATPEGAIPFDDFTESHEIPLFVGGDPVEVDLPEIDFIIVDLSSEPLSGTIPEPSTYALFMGVLSMVAMFRTFLISRLRQCLGRAL